jgi:hypothetical protein
MIPYTFVRSSIVPPKYSKGQAVIIMPIKNKHLGPKDYRLEPYKGMIAEVADYYWIDMGSGVPRICYIYRVRISDENKEIVVHEDEIKAWKRRFWETLMSKLR